MLIHLFLLFLFFLGFFFFAMQVKTLRDFGTYYVQRESKQTYQDKVILVQ